MTVAQFQKLNEISETTPDTIERLAWTVCALFDKTEAEVAAMSGIRFIRYAAKIEKQINAKPKKFFGTVKLQTDATKITFGQFVECQYWVKNGTIPALDLIAASILIKRKEHSKDAERVRSKHFAGVIEQVSRFIESMNDLIKSYKGLFEHEETEEEETEQEKSHPFIEKYGWIFSATELAALERIELDKVYDLPVIQALNGLSYLKAKVGYDKHLAKK